MNVMPVSEVIAKVAEVCKKNKVERLDLFDYDGTFAEEKFQDIINVYYPLFEKLRDNVKKYYTTE